MAFSLLTGKPGGGKGLLSMDILIDELRKGKRPILTNLAVELFPWVNGKGQAQLGLLSYLTHKYGQAFGAEWRVQRLSDEQAAEFYLWRLVGTGKDAKLTRAEPVREFRNNGKEGPIVSFATDLLALGGVLYIIDEAWKFWSSRNWKDTGEGVLFYSSQHRKCGDDIFLVTQHAEQVETAIRRVVQDFWIVRNRSMLRVGIFKQPNDFRVGVYDTINAKAPMMTKGFKLDVNGIAQTYDTSAGVGLAGRMVGDLGKKRKGVPFWVLVACAVFVPCLVFGAVHKGLTWGARKVIPKVDVGSQASTNTWERGVASSLTGGGHARVAGFNPGAPGELAGQASRSGDVASRPGEAARTMTGTVHLPGHFLILLSDGETVDTAEPGRVSYLCARYAVIDGVTNRMRYSLCADELRPGPARISGGKVGALAPASAEWRERSRPGSAWAPSTGQSAF
jgi:Zonular occludens toxin (Zot)